MKEKRVCVQQHFFLRDVFSHITDVSPGLCSASGRACEAPFRPAALRRADCTTPSALACSLAPAASKNERLGLCMVITNTKYVAAGQKSFCCSGSVICLQLRGCLMLCLQGVVSYAPAFCTSKLLHAKVTLCFAEWNVNASISV